MKDFIPGAASSPEHSIDAKMEYEGCKVRIVDTYEGQTAYVRFLLADIEPLSIKVIESPQPDLPVLHLPYYYITMMTSGSKNSIEMSVPDQGVNKAHFVSFAIWEEGWPRIQTMSFRSMRAFKRAVQLCGGKVEPF